MEVKMMVKEVVLEVVVVVGWRAVEEVEGEVVVVEVEAIAKSLKPLIQDTI